MTEFSFAVKDQRQGSRTPQRSRRRPRWQRARVYVVVVRNLAHPVVEEPASREQSLSDVGERVFYDGAFPRFHLGAMFPQDGHWNFTRVAFEDNEADGRFVNSVPRGMRYQQAQLTCISSHVSVPLSALTRWPVGRPLVRQRSCTRLDSSRRERLGQHGTRPGSDRIGHPGGGCDSG